MRRRLRLCFPWLFFFFFHLVSGDLHRGDIVPTSARMHFKSTKQRTQWVDVLEKHCPSFGKNKMVAFRVDMPSSLTMVMPEEGDEIKIQFAFDNERHFTVWLPLQFSSSVSQATTTTTMATSTTALKGREKKVPMIAFTFTHHIGHIVNVKSESSFIEMKGAKKQLHHQHFEALAEEWSSTSSLRSAWPKHVLLKYEFIEKESVDVNKGLGVLMAFMLLVFIASVSKIKMDEDVSGEDEDSKLSSRQKGLLVDEAPNVIVGASTSDELVRRQGTRRAADFI